MRANYRREELPLDKTGYSRTCRFVLATLGWKWRAPCRVWVQDGFFQGVPVAAGSATVAGELERLYPAIPVPT